MDAYEPPSPRQVVAYPSDLVGALASAPPGHLDASIATMFVGRDADDPLDFSEVSRIERDCLEPGNASPFALMVVQVVKDILATREGRPT